MKQEENYDRTDSANVESLFLGIQESYSEAQQRATEENKTFQRTEFFRMEKLGTYSLRALPLAPNPDGTADRKTYEYPVHQMLLEIEKPTTSGKQQFMYVTVPRITNAGYSVDLIDTYRKMAIAEAKERGDDKLAEKISGGTYGGGLKYTYGHVMYILDLKERAKGLQLLTLTHSQFKELDERKFNLWQKKLDKDRTYPCVISSVYQAYPVEIEKKKNGQKTEYKINIDNESDTVPLTLDELNALMAAPRIPEIIYRYSRYQFEATVEFLKQCDQKYDMNLMDSQEMTEAVDKINSELPADDKGSFTFDKRTKDAKDNPVSGISLDDLFYRFDELQEKGLGDKTEEGQELRGMIRAFIEQEKLPVRVSRTTANKDLLEEIESVMENSGAKENAEPDTTQEQENTPATGADETETTGRSRRRRQ